MYWYNDPHSNSDAHPSAESGDARDVARSAKEPVEDRQRLRPRDEAYWDATLRVVMDYFELQAGAHCSETLEEGFIAWLERSPAELRRFEEGDDMRRAALVDWFLKVVR